MQQDRGKKGLPNTPSSTTIIVRRAYLGRYLSQSEHSESPRVEARGPTLSGREFLLISLFNLILWLSTRINWLFFLRRGKPNTKSDESNAPRTGRPRHQDTGFCFPMYLGFFLAHACRFDSLRSIWP